MTLLMRCEGLVGGVYINPTEDPTGQYLQSYAPNAFGGRGDAQWTSNPALAKHFPTAVELLTLWKTQSTVRPLRPDGLPNRPLTAFSVSTVQLKEDI